MNNSTSGRAPNDHFFTDMVATYQNDLYRFCMWLCHNKEDTEEVVQEALLRAWRSLGKLKKEKSVKPWLFAIVRRENHRIYHKQSKLHLVDIEDYRLKDSSIIPSDEFLVRDTLTKIISSLDTKYSDPLLLQIKEGLSSAEIAQRLDLKVATVATRIFRAKRMLKEMLL